MKKIIPYPSICFFQVLISGLFPLAIIPIILYVDEWIKYLFYILLGIICLSNFIVLLFSFFKWWNIPIIISKSGIIKKGKQYLWSEVSSVNLKIKMLTKYGPFKIVVINYINGTNLKFEFTELACKLIKDSCEDKIFQEKFEKIFDEFI